MAWRIDALQVLRWSATSHVVSLLSWSLSFGSAGSESRYRAALARAAWDDKYVTTLAASMSQHPDVGLGKILFFRQLTDALRPLTATHE